MSRNAAWSPSQTSGPQVYFQRAPVLKKQKHGVQCCHRSMLHWPTIQKDSLSSKPEETNAGQVKPHFRRFRTRAFESNLKSPFENPGLELVLRARCGPQCANNGLMDPWTNTYAHTDICARDRPTHDFWLEGCASAWTEPGVDRDLPPRPTCLPNTADRNRWERVWGRENQKKNIALPLR